MGQKWVESATQPATFPPPVRFREIDRANQEWPKRHRGQKMALTATEIGSIVQELASALADGWIQKISQPLPDTLILEIRVPGHTRRLLYSLRDDTARLHLVHQHLPNPPTPPSFCQLLRARIQGARIDTLQHMSGDRIVRLDLTSRDGPVSLVAELFSRNADLLFLDGEGLVLATLRHNKDRVGQPYQAPAAAPFRSSSHQAVVHEPDTQPQTDVDPFPLSSRLEAFYREREAELSHQAQARERESGLRKHLKKLLRRMAALRQDLEQAGRYEPYARYGELLKANLGLLKKGQNRVAVVDYYDEQLPELTIPLDPTKGPQANMDAYFAKYRKFVTAQREISPRIAAIEAEVQQTQTELETIKGGTWQPPSTEGQTAVRGTPALRRKRDREGESRGPFRRFVSSDGHPILVGRNARENDELTFGLAKSEDLWLHARGTPGSHVVVRLDKGTEPPPETIRDAATLALLYSDLKKSGKGDVIYTRRKWVKKAKGQAAGAVTVTQEKSIYVTLDKPRLDALKSRSAPR
ncbi:MAG TPA: NFACT family protein [Nitrospira sp.]|nr:NFACT family protein [Nitrospira sp.]HMZ96045.1 NFACT family protein [Nitrospira sp.]